jgi:transposase
MTSSRGEKKMWCVPALNHEYIERMEGILNLLAAPPSKDEPIVALDERPVQLLDSKRKGRSAKPGKIARQDYEYERAGTANIYCIVAPHEGRHLSHATCNRKAPQFVAALIRVAKAYPSARTIHLIVDNLNIHAPGAVMKVLGESAGLELWSRFTVHYTPKHGSWLNPAEIEASLISRECLAGRRIPLVEELCADVEAWNRDANLRRRKIKWRFKTADARRTFQYEERISAQLSRH